MDWLTNLSKPAKITLIVLLVVFFFAILIGGNFNSLVGSKNRVDQKWSNVEVQYQRRFDLIGNLVASVKGAQGQEKEVFDHIADARTKYNSAQTTDGKAQAASAVETNVALLPRLQEAYPDLKSNSAVQDLMKQLATTEDQVAKVRDDYNKTATNYNITVQRFPKNLFAGAFGYHTVTLFKSDQGAAKAPTVNFGNASASPTL